MWTRRRWDDGPDKLCIVLEFCSNGSLDDLLKNQCSQWDGVYCEIIRGVTSCFAYLHHELEGPPMMHRDLKPANVMIADDMTARVGDFGEQVLCTYYETTRSTKSKSSALLPHRSRRFGTTNEDSDEEGEGGDVALMTMVGTPLQVARDRTQRLHEQ